MMTSEVVTNLVTKGETSESAGLLGKGDCPPRIIGGQVPGSTGVVILNQQEGSISSVPQTPSIPLHVRELFDQAVNIHLIVDCGGLNAQQ